MAASVTLMKQVQHRSNSLSLGGTTKLSITKNRKFKVHKIRKSYLIRNVWVLHTYNGIKNGNGTGMRNVHSAVNSSGLINL